jgi:hypothetical protein
VSKAQQMPLSPHLLPPWLMRWLAGQRPGPPRSCLPCTAATDPMSRVYSSHRPHVKSIQQPPTPCQEHTAATDPMSRAYSSHRPHVKSVQQPPTPCQERTAATDPMSNVLLSQVAGCWAGSILLTSRPKKYKLAALLHLTMGPLPPQLGVSCMWPLQE